MKQVNKPYEELVREMYELRLQLEEANETIEAIRTGQVDALVVKNDNGHELYTLKSADQTYRVFIEKMTEGAITLNKEGLIVYSNSQFAKMVGLPLSKVIGLSFVSFINSQDIEVYNTLVAEGWSRDVKGETILESTAKLIPVQLSLTTLELDEGTAMSIILTDLTVHKQTQLLLKANNEKLIQINHQLESSNNDLQQFASVASHDLQEPIRKIQIFSNLLKEKFSENLTAEGKNFLEKIISSSNRMKTLVVDILNYSLLTQDENNYSFTDLNTLVKEVLEDYEMVLKEKHAKVSVEELPTIEVNPGQIRQVFQNLISNALKFVQNGTSPFLHISSRFTGKAAFQNDKQAEGEYCYICFRDNGIGFPDSFASNIFTLFRRLHAKDKFEGTGIGLAISKKIIEKHNGHIIAKGWEGKGSEFIIILPLSQKRYNN